MSNFSEQIKQRLLEKRPNLSESSIRSYVSTLKNLPQKVTLKYGSGLDISFYDDDDNLTNVIKYLKNEPSNKSKTVLSALYVITGNDLIRNNMIDGIRDVQQTYSTQEKSKSENENWIEWTDILKLHSELQDEANVIFKQQSITALEKAKLNEYVLLSCFVLNEPRRSQDYSLLKIRNFDKDVDNYIDKGDMVFNKYKTAKQYGQQTITMNPKLKLLINKWSKINKSDHLIVSKTGKMLNVSQITKLLNKIFGNRNISVNIIRHSYLSHVYKDMPTISDMQQRATNMGHAFQTAITMYVKK